MDLMVCFMREWNKKKGIDSIYKYGDPVELRRRKS